MVGFSSSPSTNKPSRWKWCCAQSQVSWGCFSYIQLIAPASSSDYTMKMRRTPLQVRLSLPHFPYLALPQPRESRSIHVPQSAPHLILPIVASQTKCRSLLPWLCDDRQSYIFPFIRMHLQSLRNCWWGIIIKTSQSSSSAHYPPVWTYGCLLVQSLCAVLPLEIWTFI